jgi:hypothetical protein
MKGRLTLKMPVEATPIGFPKLGITAVCYQLKPEHGSHCDGVNEITFLKLDIWVPRVGLWKC